MHRLLLLALIALSPVPVAAQSLAGPAQVIDGDTIDINGERIRLFGVDAPESAQRCQRGGADWACGSDATRQLESLIAGRTVRCEARDTDAYGRTVAVCRVGSLDLGQAMVQTGSAVAFRRYASDYIADEDAARAARRGLWNGSFVSPSDWRAERRGSAVASTVAASRAGGNRRTAPLAAGRGTSAGQCAIKGNINRRGEHIYHLPGMPYYDATRPEQLFCSEAEAQAAGFRRAIVR